MFSERSKLDSISTSIWISDEITEKVIRLGLSSRELNCITVGEADQRRFGVLGETYSFDSVHDT